jgi:hypothetical protein
MGGLASGVPCFLIAAVLGERAGRSRTGRSPAAQRRRRRP